MACLSLQPVFWFLAPSQCRTAEPSEDERRTVAAVLSNWPPHYITDEQTGRAGGFAVDIMKAVAASTGITVEYRTYDSWPEIFAAAENGEVDIVPNMGITEERRRLFNFTVPVETFRISIFIRETTTDIYGLEDLRGRIVGGVKHNKGLLLIRKNGESETVAFNSLEEALVALLSGNIEALVYPEQVVLELARETGLESRLKTVGSPLQEIKRGIAVRKGRPELFTILDAAVRDFITTPSYRKIYAKWYHSPLPFWTVSKVFKFMGGLLLSLCAFMVAWRYYSLASVNRALKESMAVRQRQDKQLRLARFAIENAGDAIFLIDAEARFLDANPFACERLGYGKEELLSKTVADIDPDFPRKKWLSHWRELKQAGRLRFETRHRTKTGDIFPVEVTANFLHFDGREYNCAFVRDISEQRQAETKLRLAREEWERTFAAIGDIATIQDTRQRILQANRRTAEVLDTTPEALVGKYCYEVFTGLTAPCPRCPVTRSISDRRNHTAEIENRKLRKKLLVSASPIMDETGELRGAVHFAKDITEQKNLEERLQQAQKMEAIGTLAGGIAHDFNNILSLILGYADLALTALPNDSEAAPEIREVLKAAGRATDLVKQILTFSRQTDVELHPLKIQLVVKEALRLLRASIPTTIEIRQKLDPACGAILADPTHIHQILMNLCTNAYHAMQETGGVLGVKLFHAHLTAADLTDKMDLKPGPHTVLEVSDTGCGMDREIASRVFEPYFTTKERGKGTGLGLAVVHGFVKNLRGDIKVYSEPGKGSTFRVYLPEIESGEVLPNRETDAAPLPPGSERIIAVDDEKMIVRMIERMLTDLGYRVTSFTDSRKALEEFTGRPDAYDLFITDMTMPGLTGEQLAKQVLAIRPGMPVILCTGFSELINEEKAAAMGIKKYIIKPLVREELAAAVREALDARA